MESNSYLLVPSCEEGNGTGHLRRMIDLYKKLKTSSPAFVFIPVKTVPEKHKILLSQGVDSNNLYFETLPEMDKWDFIVVDYRNSTFEFIKLLQSKGFLIGIDEGGASRGSFRFLIDIIPSPWNKIKPNIFETGLMDLPEKHLYDLINYQAPVHGRILITFGGEDLKDLTSSFLEFIEIHGYFVNSEITAVTGKDGIHKKYSGNIKMLVNPENLKNKLSGYDLIITQFGLTAFEALASGVPFILLNPTVYHHKLSLYCGFYEIGIIKPDRKKFDKFICEGAEFRSIQERYIPGEYKSLKDIIVSLNNTEPNCPVCHHGCGEQDLLYRYNTGNFYNCSGCGITFQVAFSALRDNYKKEYFFDDYKKQYGRTYLEDFENIQKLAIGRLKIISRFKPQSSTDKASLLDVGCAYGPFLVESEKYGYRPSGVEIIPEAADYVRGNLGFPVFEGPFEDVCIKNRFDILTMWYVIEHFTDPDLILSRVNRMLKPGGIFAFSTPNCFGITGRKSMDLFLEESPLDHVSVWNPGVTPRILLQFGFRIKRIRITGHHPERFPDFLGIKIQSGNKAVRLISRIFKLGDTFEVYAEKMKEIND